MKIEVGKYYIIAAEDVLIKVIKIEEGRFYPVSAEVVFASSTALPVYQLGDKLEYTSSGKYSYNDRIKCWNISKEVTEEDVVRIKMLHELKK